MDWTPMSQEIVKQFDNAEFGALRVVKDDQGEPWFVANDVINILALDHTALRKLDQDEKGRDLIPTPGGKQPMNVVSEPGFYRLVLKSRKPEAKAFQRWVTHEVLPAIRQDGGYMVARDETPEQTMARAVLIAQQTIERQTKQIEEMRPKAVFADAVSVSKSTILVADLAKILKQNGMSIGSTRLFALLREQGYLCRQKGAMWNTPTQRSMEMGLFEVKETVITHSDGHTTINKTPKVTGKGQIYFVNHFCGGSDG